MIPKRSKEVKIMKDSKRKLGWFINDEADSKAERTLKYTTYRTCVHVLMCVDVNKKASV